MTKPNVPFIETLSGKVLHIAANRKLSEAELPRSSTEVISVEPFTESVREITISAAEGARPASDGYNLVVHAHYYKDAWSNFDATVHVYMGSAFFCCCFRPFVAPHGWSTGICAGLLYGGATSSSPTPFDDDMDASVNQGKIGLFPIIIR